MRETGRAAGRIRIDRPIRPAGPAGPAGPFQISALVRARGQAPGKSGSRDAGSADDDPPGPPTFRQPLGSPQPPRLVCDRMAPAHGGVAAPVLRDSAGVPRLPQLLAGQKLPHGARLRRGQLGQHVRQGLFLGRLRTDFRTGCGFDPGDQRRRLSLRLHAGLQGLGRGAAVGNLLPDHPVLHQLPRPNLRLAGHHRRAWGDQRGARPFWDSTPSSCSIPGSER